MTTIVVIYGGGTALATQKECLQLMDCFAQAK
jgi:hydroxymethylglutaryl-CoA reductase (NADPH)